MASATADVAGFTTRVSRPSVRKKLLRLVRRYPLGAAGASCLILAALIAIFADVIAPHDPNRSIDDSRLLSVSATHWFGTDNLARDLLSRILFGLRTSLLVASGTTILALVTGVGLGLVSGYVGSWLDAVIQRAVDIMMAFPGLILALTLVAMLGSTLQNIVIAIAISSVPNVIRLTRGVVLSVKEEDFVLSARAIGAGTPRILLRHILPNILAPIIVAGSVLFGVAIIVEASLSFLGVGVKPPTPTLGGMLSGQSRRFMLQAWWMAVFPGLAITTLVFAVNLLGDALRDALDPRLRGDD